MKTSNGNHIGELASRVYSLLSESSPEERSKVIVAACALLGEGIPAAIGATKPLHQVTLSNTMKGAGQGTAKELFIHKQPKNKGEELATAARFREQQGLGDTHTKEDLKAVIEEARRNFDANNFARDMNNAQRQAGFFMMGGERGGYRLSHHGVSFVDALPDREVARGLKKTTKSPAKKKKKAVKA